MPFTCDLNIYIFLFQCSGPSMKPAINSGGIVLTEHISVTRRTIEKWVLVTMQL